jgi:hypothetical protein
VALPQHPRLARQWLPQVAGFEHLSQQGHFDIHRAAFGACPLAESLVVSDVWARNIAE